MRDEVAQLNSGKSPVEELSGETNTMVTDVMDIDRTPELLAWLFSGIFGPRVKQQQQQPAESAAPTASPSSPTTYTTTTTSGPVVPFQSGSTGQEPLSAVPSRSSSSSQSLSVSVASSRPGDAGEADGHPTTTAAPPSSPSSGGSKIETAIVGGGCFWCIEACFHELHGVMSCVSGYAGGHVPNPTYQQVCSKTTGHAEVVQIQYDATVLSYKEILQIFMSLHDPTTPNRSGSDVGPQYRSIILTHDAEQTAVAAEVLAEANRSLWFGRRVCTEVAPLRAFYPAESYHQRYYSRNPGAGYCVFVVRPKLQEFRRKYSKLLRSDATVLGPPASSL